MSQMCAAMIAEDFDASQAKREVFALFNFLIFQWA